jgi:flagellar biosynthesis/type III secretory pathway chaperone
MSTPDRSVQIAELLHALQETLQAERSALIANDAERIYECSENKQRHLRRLNELPAQNDALSGFTPDLRALAEMNIANGALIARRRQETVWTLRQLGLYEREGGYDANGGMGSTVRTRHRAVV